MKPKQKLAVHFLLDSSGSMCSHKESSIRGFNEFVEGLASAFTPSFISLSTFAGTMPRPVIERVPVYDMPMLTDETFHIGGGTAMYGAMMWGVKQLDKVDAEQKALVVLTDGSTGDDYALKDLKEAMAKAQASGMLVILLYPELSKEMYNTKDHDDYRAEMRKINQGLGIPPEFVLAYDLANITEVMATSAQAVLRYGATNSLAEAAFTEEERKNVG